MTLVSHLYTNLKEIKGTLRVGWPRGGNSSRLRRLRDDIWPTLVGVRSKLLVRVEPTPSRAREDARQLDLRPDVETADGGSVVQIDHLRRGACYRVSR